jgi:twitching motility protein PilT
VRQVDRRPCLGAPSVTMARIDTFIAQLVQQDGDALLLEGGNNIFLVKAGEMDPLVDPRRGVLQNEHVLTLIRDVAPPGHVEQVALGLSTAFVYRSPSGAVMVKTATRDGRFMARIKPDATAAVTGEGPSTTPAPPPATLQAIAPGFNVHASQEGVAVDDNPPAPAFGAAPAFGGRSAFGRGPMPEPAPPPPAAAPALPSTADGKPRVEAWFKVFIGSRASDLHLTSGSPAMMRIDGDIKPEPLIPTLNADALGEHLYEIMPKRNKLEFEETNDTDFAYELPGARLRCNIFRDRRGIGAVFRKIPTKILSAKDLNLPQAIIDLGKLKKGLVLVTGPTGSGKSTTLAALVDWVNANRSDHIITVEDPIEFVHEPKKCLIHQRQVGEHTSSFARALRAALREDPDIVLVGEMRDLETVAIAIETAETGHLVFGTLHTSTAASTVDRIIDQFSADRQDQIRMMLSESLKGVVSQTLCKKKGGGRVAALEILLSTMAIANAIRERKTHQIPSMMQTSRALGMQTLNDALARLVKDGLITPEEGVDKSLERSLLVKELRNAGIAVNDAEEEKK